MDHEELGRLLSLISHEVRAPLGVMRGYLRLVEQQGAELSENHRHAIAAALKAGDHAAGVLDQLSALARLHRGEVATTLEPTPLESLLRSAANAVITPTEPAVTIHIGETPPVSLRIDHDMLRAGLASLISAVVRAQVRDGGVFLLAREDSRDGRDGITLTIGAGETVNPTYREVPLNILRGGLGLELPIAEYLVGAHHGRLSELRDDDRFVGVAVWLPL